MRRPIQGMICAAGLVLLLSGCEGNNLPGSPTVPAVDATEPSPSASVDSEVPGYGAPKVEHPLDVSDIMQRPCETLTEAQIADLLGTGTNKEERDNTGPTCAWHGYGEQSAFVAVGFPTVTDLGLTGIYRAKGNQYQFFKELEPVRGFPAVAWGTTDETAQGRCSTAVGLADRVKMDVTVTLSEKNIGKKDPCEAAHGVLDMVIGNIQGGNR